jgi:hypothetical protein
MMRRTLLCFLIGAVLPAITSCAVPRAQIQAKTAIITPQTPSPKRFVVKGARLFDLKKNTPVFFRGMDYSPYMINETALDGEGPGNDDRYAEHLRLMQSLKVNYLHVFPMKMPPRFFAALDKTDLVYGQSIFVWPYAEDFLAESFYKSTMDRVKEVIDRTYKVGRPDRLVLFSVGDELKADAVVRTDALHPNVHDYHGKHLTVTHRTPTEVALARLIDGAMDYELTRYGRRHLYCHTSWTHIGPVPAPDLELPNQNVLDPDMGDLVCMNIYTYARGVLTAPPGSVTGTNYQGYLEKLAAQTNKPILITQVGLSTSPYEPKPWVPGFGGHKVADVPQVFSAIWRDIHTAKGNEKYCGIAFFEFQDEWWKSGETSSDSAYHNSEDPEEWFGIYKIGTDNQLVPKGRIPETIRMLYGEID